jgi:hypothetical protein
VSYNKYRFESFQQFIDIQNLAMANGYKTAEEFDNYLAANYSHLKK